MQTDKWLLWAERIDALRIIPRIIIFTYFGFFMFAWLFVVEWFMHYDWTIVEGNELIAAAVAGFPAVILGILTTVLRSLTKSYWQGGRDWDETED